MTIPTAVTKQELIDALHEDLNLLDIPVSKANVATILSVLGGITFMALVRGERVTLPGLGRLQSDVGAARRRRHPATGLPMEVPGKRLVRFSACGDLREALNN